MWEYRLTHLYWRDEVPASLDSLAVFVCVCVDLKLCKVVIELQAANQRGVTRPAAKILSSHRQTSHSILAFLILALCGMLTWFHPM